MSGFLVVDIMDKKEKKEERDFIVLDSNIFLTRCNLQIVIRSV